MKKRTMALVLSLALVAVAVIGGTLAYLTDTKSVTNTFSVGDVKILLDETAVDEFGVALENTARRTENNYKLLPGHSYIKDPIVHVQPNSEACYVRVRVTVSKADKVTEVFGESFNLEDVFKGHDSNKWDRHGITPNATDKTVVYEYWYKELVPATTAQETKDLDGLFTSIEMPGTLDNDDIAKLNGVTINVVAHAIQADGFKTDDQGSAMKHAWEAFDAQAATPATPQTPAD